MNKKTMYEIGRPLHEKEMVDIVGGGSCYCGCHWEGQGGSTSSANSSANNAGNQHSCYCDTRPEGTSQSISG